MLLHVEHFLGQILLFEARLSQLQLLLQFRLLIVEALPVTLSPSCSISSDVSNCQSTPLHTRSE